LLFIFVKYTYFELNGYGLRSYFLAIGSKIWFSFS